MPAPPHRWSPSEPRLPRLCGRRGADEVHRAAGSIAIESMADVEVLLEVVPQREIDERAPVRGQFHRGRKPSLDHGNLADGQMAVQLMDVGTDLETVLAGQARWFDAGAGDHDHPQRRNL